MARNTGTVITTLRDVRATVYVIRDDHWGEYRVELWIEGERQEAADYHTEDRADARRTGNAMLAHATA
jgi:hypothetical protein